MAKNVRQMHTDNTTDGDIAREYATLSAGAQQLCADLIRVAWRQYERGKSGCAFDQKVMALFDDLRSIHAGLARAAKQYAISAYEQGCKAPQGVQL